MDNYINEFKHLLPQDYNGIVALNKEHGIYFDAIEGKFALRFYCHGKKYKIMPVQYSKSGYKYVTYKLNNKVHIVPMHKLVAEYHYGKLKDGLVTRHLDGNKINNHYLNLKYGTLKENSNDSKKHGTLYFCNDHPRKKYTDDEIASIRQIINTSNNLKQVKQKVNQLLNKDISFGYISKLKHNMRRI